MAPSPRRILKLFLLLGLPMVGGLVWLAWIPNRIYDRAHLLSSSDGKRLNGYLAAIMRESGVDIRVMTENLPAAQSVERRALEEMRRLGVGRRAEKRGLLLYFDPSNSRFRIEVGPHLEGIFTDAFLGFVVREHTDAFLADTSAELAFRTTLIILHHRIREAALRRDFDPARVSAVIDSTMLAAGGGVTAALQSATAFRLPPLEDAEVAAALAPGSTPAATIHTYLTWLHLPVYVPNAHFLTLASRGYLLDQFRMTPAYWRYWRYEEGQGVFQIVVRGDRAIAICTNDPFISPKLLWKTAKGWQIDLDAELTNVRNWVGDEYTWTMVRTNDAYGQAFADLYEDIGILTRLRGGDNTPLPIRGSLE